MGLKIKNIKLDKEKYIYWIDSNMILSFELESDKDGNIEEIVIFYWYNFYWKQQKHKASNDKINEKNTSIQKWINEKSFSIPINFFNLNINNLKIKNYINIEIKNWFLNKNINEKLLPNIIIDENTYWLKNIIFPNNISFWKSSEEKIESLILKSNNIEYEKIINEINEKEKRLREISRSFFSLEPIKWKEQWYSFLSDEINNLNEKKVNFYIIKDNKKEIFKELNEKKIETIKNWREKPIEKLLDEVNLIQKKIYECYSSENEIEYNKSINNFYNNILIDENKWDTSINISPNIEKNKSDFIIIKKHFKWFFTSWIDNILEENSLLADFIHKDIYNKLKENTIIKIFDKLVRSEIYNSIYKYILIIPALLITTWLLNSFILRIMFKNTFITAFFILFPPFFIIISKLFEKFFEYKLKKSIYNFKLVDKKTIENNLKNKLINWKLEILDLIKKFDFKVQRNNMTYNFAISINLNIWTYHTTSWMESRQTLYHDYILYNLTLFDYTWKWYFDLNKIKLLNNNYNNLKQLLLKSNKKDWTKVYYTLDYNFKSSYLQDISWTINLNLEN